METPQFPFRCRWQLTQGYADNANNYAEGKHGAYDILPLKDDGTVYPADIYPVFSGRAISIQNSDPRRGKGIKVRSTHTDTHFINYLKANNVVPKNYQGKVYADILDWHCLEVTDLDGEVDQNTPIAKAGNTGWVFSQGKEVPDSMKGVPPYPGLHDHHEHILSGENGVFNLDKDPKGRIDPQIILNYKPTDMFLQVEGELTLVHKMGDQYFEVATSPEFYPMLKEKFRIPDQLSKVSRAEVDAHKGGQLVGGFYYKFN